MTSNRIVSRPNEGQTNIRQFKLALLGESAVGKSSLLSRYVRGQFQNHHGDITAGGFLTRTVRVNDLTVNFEIWDTTGRDRCHTLAIHRDVRAAIVVYDLTNKDSFNQAKVWVKELKTQTSPNTVIALAGNKTDIYNKRAVETAEANSYATENGLLFMETSAKTSINVSEIFMAIAEQLLKGEQNLNPNRSIDGQRGMTATDQHISRFFTFADGKSPVIKNLSEARSLLESDPESENDEIEWSDPEDLTPAIKN